MARFVMVVESNIFDTQLMKRHFDAHFHTHGYDAAAYVVSIDELRDVEKDRDGDFDVIEFEVKKGAS